ncbi:MAG: hypothetical protein ACRDOM_04645 [Nocardioides sp.]
MTPDPADQPGLIDRLPLASWRLVVACSGLLGVGYAAQHVDLWWEGLSQQASLATALLYFALAGVGLVRPQVSWSWLRGCLATLLVLVAVGFQLVLDGDLGSRDALLEHVVTPVLVVVDYLVVGRDGGRRWWPASWLVLPAGYLVYAITADVTRYDALDPNAPDRLGLLGVLLLALAVGFVLWGLVRARLSAYDRDISASGR